MRTRGRRTRWQRSAVGALGGAAAAAAVLFGVARARAFELRRPGDAEAEAEEPDVSEDAHPEPPPGQLPRIRDKREARADELVIVQKLKVERRTAAAYERLLAAAEAAGFAAPLFHLASAYRPDARQQTLYARALKRYGSPQEARKWVAAPGGSSHRTGRALDVHLGMENDSKNVAALAASEPGKWLRKHAASFGFALYDAEPWHIEFNPEKT